jgi:hypothetical protein
MLSHQRSLVPASSAHFLFLPFLLYLPVYVDHSLLYGTQISLIFFISFFVFLLLHRISWPAWFPFLVLITAVAPKTLLPVGFAWYVSQLPISWIHAEDKSSRFYTESICFFLFGAGLLSIAVEFHEIMLLTFVGYSFLYISLLLLRRLPVFCLPLAFVPFLLFLAARRPVADKTPFYEDMQLLWSPEYSTRETPKPSFFRNLDQLKFCHSVMFPLFEAPVYKEDNGDLHFSSFLTSIIPEFKSHYPIWYVFREGKTHWMLGFKSLSQFKEQLKEHALQPHEELNISIPAVLLSQVLSYDDYFRVSSKAKMKNPSFLHPLSERDREIPSIGEHHQKFPYLIWRGYLEKLKGYTDTYTANRITNTVQYFLEKKEYVLLDNWMLFLETIYGQNLHYNMLRAMIEAHHGRYWSAKQFMKPFFEKKIAGPKEKVLTFQILEKEESQFVSYGYDYNYDDIKRIAKEMYDNGNPRDTRWMQFYLYYSRVAVSQPHRAFSQDVSGCSGGCQ